jgi:hypothetical protein
MGQIIFYKTKDLKLISSFYQNELGFKLWFDQKTCQILKGNNLLLGFCQNSLIEKETMITFFFKTKEEVDDIHRNKFPTMDPPKENKKYNIYQFFSKDPEGRILEFQHFLHPIDWVWN